MTTEILIGIVLVALVGFLYFSKLQSRQSSASNATMPSLQTVEIDQTIADSPVGFGYKCMWFAVKTSNQQRIAEMLKLKNVAKCNWRVGIDKAYEGAVYITPPINGWTLACGLGLPGGGDSKERINEIKQILSAMSSEFGEAQYFCTHRVVELHCWIRALKGKVTRVYSFSGEDGGNIMIEGIPTEFEKQNHLINTFSKEAKNEHYFETNGLVIPDEEFIMKLAGKWSVDPTQIGSRQDISPALGLLGQQ